MSIGIDIGKYRIKIAEVELVNNKIIINPFFDFMILWRVNFLNTHIKDFCYSISIEINVHQKIEIDSWLVLSTLWNGKTMRDIIEH